MRIRPIDRNRLGRLPGLSINDPAKRRETESEQERERERKKEREREKKRGKEREREPRAHTHTPDREIERKRGRETDREKSCNRKQSLEWKPGGPQNSRTARYIGKCEVETELKKEV